MSNIRREPYTILDMGWFSLFMGVFVVGLFGYVIALSIIKTQTTLGGQYNLKILPVLVVTLIAVVSLILQIRRYLSSEYMTKKRLSLRSGFFSGQLVPSLKVATAATPQLSKLFGLLEYRDTKFINSFGNDTYTYGDLRYTVYRKTKNGEYAAEHRYLSILELKLSRELPNILLDSVTNKKQFRYLIDKNQIDRLEGGFDEAFTTYFPLHYEIDARSIIAPDVMAPMLNAKEFDMEIIGDKLYLFGPMVPQDQVYTMIQKGLRIQRALADHIPAYRDERIAGQQNRSEVAYFGKSLQQSSTRYIVTAAIIAIYFIVAVAPSLFKNSSSFGIMIWPALAIAVVLIITLKPYFEMRKEKKKNTALYETYLSQKAANSKKDQS